MKYKKYSLTFLLISFSCLVQAAKLPGSGYDGPYRAPADDYDRYLYSDDYGFSDEPFAVGGRGFRTMANSQGDTYCAMQTSSGSVCQTCCDYATANTNDSDGLAGWLNAYTSCMDSNTDCDPGWEPLPVGNTLFLLLFAPLYAAFALWRKKRLTIVNG